MTRVLASHVLAFPVYSMAHSVTHAGPPDMKLATTDSKSGFLQFAVFINWLRPVELFLARFLCVGVKLMIPR